ncbi:unnamed protein product [Lymnaea stagnalis]|uniref:Archaemetzincin-2 n=1 Tax=Lymnaea stagnalis TaxID=6523 RepID=A0AAV2IR17_LYMST
MGVNASASDDELKNSKLLPGSDQSEAGHSDVVQTGYCLNDVKYPASLDTEHACAERAGSSHKCHSEHIKKDFEFLIGSLEKVPATAQKLYNLSKLYLTTGSSKSSDHEGFNSLFEPLAPNQPGLAEDSSDQELTSDTRSTAIPSDCSLFTPMRKSSPLYRGQTYIQWRAAQDLNNFYFLCLPKRRTIYLQPIDHFPEFVTSFRLATPHLSLDLFETLLGFAQIYFLGLEVMVRPPISIGTSGWNLSSRINPTTGQMQFCVNDFFPLLQASLPPDGLCVAGLIWTDLYPQGFNFVLGEASFQHKSAVVSFGRFENDDSCADITKVDDQVLWKLFKSLSHEVCHLLGLQHCQFFLCAMNESSSVTQALSQPLFLCPVCLRKVQRACGFDVLERYQRLQQFLTTISKQFGGSGRFQESLLWLERCISYLNT